MTNKSNFLVYVETDDRGDIAALSLEAVNAAKALAAGCGAVVSALVMGEDVSRAVEELRLHQVDKIFIKEHGGLKYYRPRRFSLAFEKVYRILSPQLMIFGNSRNGLDFAARAAIELDVPLVTDCVAIQWDQGELAFTKPVYSNNVMAVYIAGDVSCIVTLRSKSTGPSEKTETPRGEIVDIGEVDEPEIEEYKVVAREIFKDGGKKITDAEIIVAGGRGIRGGEGFLVLQELARLLDGQVGATRPPCDLGWIDPEAQIGITGAIVSPAVYFAVGVSGSFQHMAGMSGSKTIIAINTDPNANIFKISDFGVVGDYEKVLPGLIEEIGKRQRVIGYR